jgi:N-methylhydantoinase A
MPEASKIALRIAIDTGGTFTDCVYLVQGQLQVLKVLSTPANPAQALLHGLAKIAPGPMVELRHGTTVGTNTMLERKGARVAFVTTAGFEDTIAIGRQTRSKLYDWFAPVALCLVPRELRFGIPERVNAEGTILRSPTEEELAILVDQVRRSGAEAIAISLLFSFANPETEQRLEAALQCLQLPISVSHRILPEFREYERASTTVVNAYLAPRMQTYLQHLEQSVTEQHGSGVVNVMQSSGGILSARRAAPEPVRTVLSGPAGGVIGACHIARCAGFPRIIGFDMGGTSTDVFLADATAGGAQLTREAFVAGVPIGVPMLDIHTVGAGGGSLARFDSGGMLRVGPESAGAQPGPICFGRGTLPTVTDANLVLGRLDPDSFLGGGVPLDGKRTRQILQAEKGPLRSAEDYASGILRVVETEMEKAIRVISVERGHDPREFTLVAFGGGGPLHACALARALRIPTVLVPAMPGALSALGILLADVVRDFSRTVMLPESRYNEIEQTFTALEKQGVVEFAAEGLAGIAQRSLDVRYRHQGYELMWPVRLAHRSRPSPHFMKRIGKPVEIVNVRVRMIAPGVHHQPAYREPEAGDGRAACYTERAVYFDGAQTATQHYRRSQLLPGDVIRGPAMITEYTSATVLPPGCTARVDGFANLVIAIDTEGSAY